MPQVKRRYVSLSAAAAVVLGGLSLSACATDGVTETDRLAEVNGRVTALEKKAIDASDKADAAYSTAQSAQTLAVRANQRLDQLTPRVDSLEQSLASSSKPRN